MARFTALVEPESTIDDVWAAMRRLQADAGSDGAWTAAEVAATAGCTIHFACSYITRLSRSGHVATVRTESHPRRRTHYRIARSERDAPRLRPDGSQLPERPTEVLWRTMKILRADISIDTLAPEIERLGRKPDRSRIGRYLRALAAAGVLQEVQPTRGHVPAVYRLAQPLGALPPQVLRTQVVFDPNSRAVIGVAKAEEAS